MRKIKFRGKRIDNGEWVFGSFIPDALEGSNSDLVSYRHHSLRGFIRRYNRGVGKMETIEVDRETVGQYTGLEDKNGTEIYEGDIIRHHDDILSKVFYNTAHCAYLLQDISGNRNKCQCDRLGSYCSLWIEVIANIHDNPELLGGAK